MILAPVAVARSSSSAVCTDLVLARGRHLRVRGGHGEWRALAASVLPEQI